MASYQYVPIDSSQRQIRVLTIHPFQDQSSLKDLAQCVECSLHVVSLNDSPGYHALSYTWGGLEPSRPKILLDGAEVEVTVSLEQAVRTFRRESEPINFWIDAICINQEDPIERAGQVMIMADIYSSAKIVDVFLGSGTDGTDKAMEAMRRIGTAAYNAGVLSLKLDSSEQLASANDWHHSFSDPEADDPLAKVKTSLLQLSASIDNDFPYSAAAEVMRLRYWNRMWIFQEFCLGKELNITCGTTTVPYRHCFEAALLFLWLHVPISMRRETSRDGFDSSAHGQAVVAMMAERSVFVWDNTAWASLAGARNRQQRVKGSPETLAKLLERCCVADSTQEVRQAKFPRDVIYGLLGVASDAQALNIVPIYTNIASVEETVLIYTSVTRTLLESGHVDILAWCQQPKTIDHLPTWVPDFTAIKTPCSESKEEGLYAASGKSSLRIKPPGLISIDSKELNVSGVRIDTITTLGSAWNPDNKVDVAIQTTEKSGKEYAGIIQLFHEVSTFCEQAKAAVHGRIPTLNDEQKWSEAHWRIPCADQTKSYLGRARATDVCMHGYNDMRRRIELYSEITRNSREFNLTHEQLMQKVEQFKEALTPASNMYRSALLYLHNRKPFISKNGYVGLIPAHAKPGDLLIVILGAIQPFVVREVGKDRYELIGEAYVYGIMDGEFLEIQHKVEDFVLC